MRDKPKKWYCTHECDCKHPEVLCNMCGESCLLSDSKESHLDYSGLIKQVVSGGYHSTPGNGSGALDDTTNYNFSLCEFCLDWLFKNFKIPPELSHYVGGTDEQETFRSAEERVTNDEWRSQKEKFRSEYERRNSLRKVKLCRYASIAQLAERRILNSDVASSNLARGTNGIHDL